MATIFPLCPFIATLHILNGRLTIAMPLTQHGQRTNKLSLYDQQLIPILSLLLSFRPRYCAIILYYRYIVIIRASIIYSPQTHYHTAIAISFFGHHLFICLEFYLGSNLILLQLHSSSLIVCHHSQHYCHGCHYSRSYPYMHRCHHYQ